MDVETYLATYPMSADANPELLEDPAFREALNRHLHPAPDRALLPLIRSMFQQECEYRADDSHGGEYFESIYWTALFLYQIGDLSDVIPMWQAKHIDMDTGSGFDVQFLVGRGVAETIEFLQHQGTADGAAAADYLATCRDAGDFDNLAEWLSGKVAYFR